ncbi:hypothetical protein GOBAR_DD12212 [Gossypium barbadense]|nr:hypothetical protein GOBAR_DD12212 [Gossypium barbadense]
MDSPSSNHNPSQENGSLPDLLVKSVEVDLSNQVVRVLGNSPVKTMNEALEQTGRKARLIGQGVPEDFLVSAAVAEFKGPQIFGVVRLAQVSMELARIEASFSGLSPGKHGWSINEFGDLTRGAASTGKVFNPSNEGTAKQPVGDLGTLDVDKNGESFYTGVKQQLRVADLIGRSIAVYETEDRSDPGLTAAVIARSAGVGENYKKICACDGTTIWEASDKDFVTSKNRSKLLYQTEYMVDMKCEGCITAVKNKLQTVDPIGDLGTLDVDKNGEAFYTGVKQQLRVADLIGRSIAVYETEDRSDPGLTAAVIARSAGVGENYKKICACDGTTIWEASDKDFVTSKV